jgi:hypothetical protein
VFSNIVTGTITLNNVLGELLITKDVGITGPGAKVLAVSGNTTHRVFHLTNNAAVSISGLTITGGGPAVSGTNAGILQDSGTLALSDCIVSGNHANSGLGGGISAFGTVLAIRCTVSGNAGANGGGIYARGTFTAINCTVFGNTSGNFGGGIFEGSGSLFLTNCTLSGNLTFGTGGGIYNAGGTATVGNCIIAGNQATTGRDCSGAFISAGFNLIGAINDSTGWGVFGDQVGSTNSPLNALLGPLQDNGGPTLTMAPQTGSPAIDQGNTSGVTNDQRGQSRPYTNTSLSVPFGGDHSDIGAVEISPADAVVSNTNDAGGGSLRNAIQIAPPHAAITFASSVAGTIVLTTGELLLGSSLSIQGPTAGGVTISGNNASRVFDVTGSSTVNISSLTIANGNTAAQGAGIFNDVGCTLSLSNCTVEANISGANGGGLANNGNLTARNCTFSGNQAALNAGGIYTFAGPVTLRNCTIVSNTAVSASGAGGGILNYSLQAGTSNNISSTIVAGNSAASHADVIGVFTSSGYNLIGKIDYSTAVGGGANGVTTSGLTNSINHDLVGSLASPTNAFLGPLQANGGPTFTHALKPGSPAIDKGVNNGLLTDQRGAPRPFDFASIANAAGGDGSDIGAFELGSPRLNLQPAGTNVVASWPAYYGDFTLESATNLGPSNNWSVVAGTPAVVLAQFNLTNSAVGAKEFFRLRIE